MNRKKYFTIKYHGRLREAGRKLQRPKRDTKNKGVGIGPAINHVNIYFPLSRNSDRKNGSREKCKVIVKKKAGDYPKKLLDNWD